MVILLLFPYHYSGQLYGLSRHKIEAVAFALRMEDFWQPLDRVVHERAATIPVLWAVGLALAAFAYWRGKASNSLLSPGRHFILLALLLWLSAGPMPLLLDPLPSLAPYNLLYEWFPGFDRIRASSRIACLLFIELSLLLPTALSIVAWPAARVAFAAALLLQTIFLARSLDPRPRLNLVQGIREPTSVALKQVRAMLDGAIIEDGYTGIRVDPIIYREKAAQLCRDNLWPLHRCTEFFAGGPDPSNPADRCLMLSPEDFQLEKKVRRGQALMIAFRATGPYCRSHRFAFHDRTLQLTYRGPKTMRTTLRISSPVFRDVEAPVLHYAAEAPAERGTYRLEIQQSELRLQKIVEVY